MADIGDSFRPGEKVPNSGVYAVTHDKKHNKKHDVTCIKGKTFPPCAECGAGAQFVLRNKARHIVDHALFVR
jgi:hypothetical protein